MSHPYGVKPQANTLFADPILLSVRSKGRGNLHVAKDEMLLELLGFLNCIELSQFSMCSRCTYVYSMTSDLWRDLSLRFTNQSINFIRNWRDTYVTGYILISNTIGILLLKQIMSHQQIKYNGFINQSR